jgi:hypothetical protein
LSKKALAAQLALIIVIKAYCSLFVGTNAIIKGQIK